MSINRFTKNIFDRFKSKNIQVSPELQKEQIENARKQIVNCAAIMNNLMNPGVSIIIDIKGEKIIQNNGRRPAPGGVIIISKPMILESLTVTPGGQPENVPAN